jgi:hypothetical protein
MPAKKVAGKVPGKKVAAKKAAFPFMPPAKGGKKGK